MKQGRNIALGLILMDGSAFPTSALDVTLNKNGYAPLAGGQLTKSTGPGPAIAAQPLGTTGASVTFTNLAAGTTYSLDFFHNSGTGSSDFTFKVNADGTGVELVNLGGGLHTMVTGFTPNDTTLTLNTHSVTLNANGAQDGNYYIYGVFPPGSGNNSPPLVHTVIPGTYSWDNLYNSGLANEDFAFMVTSDGSTAFHPNSQYGEYARFGGSEVNPIAIKVHYMLEASALINFNTDASIFNVTNYAGTGSVVRVYEFDMWQTPGNEGINIWSFGSNTFATANMTRSTNSNIFVAGADATGYMTVNDALFRPKLRYAFTNGIVGGTDFYWETTDANYTVATALISGYFDGTNGIPLSVQVTASIIPEPNSFAMAILAGVGLILAMRPRKE